MNFKTPLAVLCAFSSLALSPISAKEIAPGTHLEALKKFSDACVDLSKKVTPSVVSVKVEVSSINVQHNPLFGQDSPFQSPFFEEFFGQRRGNVPPPRFSQGSGFIISADGYVMTNNHVVPAGATKITIHFSDDQEYPAELVYSGPERDIAILKIKAEKGQTFPHLPFAKADPQVGELVFAVGSPFDLPGTVTMGFVSATERNSVGIVSYEDFIQTDAAINPGNSGGPLINTEGEVLGMNTAIISRSGGYNGIGFAVPSDMLSRVFENVKACGKVPTAYLGVEMQPLDQELAKAFNLDKPQGALIKVVAPESPAAKAGLMGGDIITHYKKDIAKGGGWTEVKNPGMLRSIVSKMNPHSQLEIKVVRGGQKDLPFTIKLDSVDEHLSDPKVILQGLGILQYAETKYPQHGIEILQIHCNKQAYAAGLHPGNIILKVGNDSFASVAEFEALVKKAKEKGNVLLLYVQQGNVTNFIPIPMK